MEFVVPNQAIEPAGLPITRCRGCSGIELLERIHAARLQGTFASWTRRILCTGKRH